MRKLMAALALAGIIVATGCSCFTCKPDTCDNCQMENLITCGDCASQYIQTGNPAIDLNKEGVRTEEGN